MYVCAHVRPERYRTAGADLDRRMEINRHTRDDRYTAGTRKRWWPGMHMTVE